VRPIPSQQPVPELKWTVPFMSNNSDFPMRQPGIDSTGPVPVHPPSQTMPLEQLLQQQKLIQAAPIAVPQTMVPPGTPGTPAVPPPGGQAPAGNGQGTGGNGNAPAPAPGAGGGNGNGN
jgi:pilus assembly protein CpaC